MSSITLIGGRKGAGKSTLAAALSKKFYPTTFVVHFADKIRDLAYVSHEDLKPLVDEHGWDWVKNNFPWVRKLLQDIGEGMNHLDLYYWCRNALDPWNNATNRLCNLIIPDFRHLKELHYAQAFALMTERRLNVVWLDRNPNPEDPALQHVSEKMEGDRVHESWIRHEDSSFYFNLIRVDRLANEAETQSLVEKTLWT